MRLARLLTGIFVISVQRQLAHRANLAFEALLTATSIGAGAAAVAIVFTHAHRLAGWTLGETIILLGAFSIVSGLLQTFVEPNLAWFAAKVTSGELDDLLLQPVPSLFLASLGTCQPWALFQVALGLLVTAAGVPHLAHSLSAGGVLACALLLAAGVMIAWSYRVVLAGLAFWAPGLEPSVLYFAFWQLGRYPITIYHPALRLLLTYVIPVAFIATVPARALAHGSTPTLLLQSAAAALVATLVAGRVWTAGLRRYTSATS